MLHKRTRKSDITQLVLSAAHAQTKHARTMLQSIDEKFGASGVAQDEARAADIRQASLLARRELERQGGCASRAGTPTKPPPPPRLCSTNPLK